MGAGGERGTHKHPRYQRPATTHAERQWQRRRSKASASKQSIRQSAGKAPGFDLHAAIQASAQGGCRFKQHSASSPQRRPPRQESGNTSARRPQEPDASRNPAASHFQDDTSRNPAASHHQDGGSHASSCLKDLGHDLGCCHAAYLPAFCRQRGFAANEGGGGGGDG